MSKIGEANYDFQGEMITGLFNLVKMPTYLAFPEIVKETFGLAEIKSANQ